MMIVCWLKIVFWLAAKSANLFTILLDVLATVSNLLAQIGDLFLVATASGINAIQITISAGSVTVFGTAIFGAGKGALAALSDALLVLHEVTVVLSELVDVTPMPIDVSLFAVNSAEVVLLRHGLEHSGMASKIIVALLYPWYKIDT